MPSRFQVSGLKGHLWWYGKCYKKAFVSWISVDETGKGNGTKLLKEFEIHMQKIGLESVEFDYVLSKQTKQSTLICLAFFQKNGYRVAKVQYEPYDDVRLTMCKNI